MQKYSIILLTLLFSLCSIASAADQAKDYEGTLTTGVMAIGGETTGVTLKTKDGKVYELDFGQKSDLAKLAETLNGKEVVATGVLGVKEGVEMGERHIIAVSALKAKSP